MSNKNYQLAITKFNNYHYFSHGAVSSSSRVGRLKYNHLLPTPVINTTPKYDDKSYKPPIFKKKHFSRNTYYPGTSEGSRNKFYNFQSSCQTNKIVDNAHNFHRKYMQQTYIKTRIKLTLDDDYIEQLVQKIISDESGDLDDAPNFIRMNNIVKQFVELPVSQDNDKSYDEIINQSSYIIESEDDTFDSNREKHYVYLHDTNKSKEVNIVKVSPPTSPYKKTFHQHYIPDHNSITSGLPIARYSSADSLHIDNNTEENSVDINDIQHLLEWVGSQEQDNASDPILHSYATSTTDLQAQLKSLYENAGNFIDTLLRQFISGDVDGVRQLLNTDYYNQLAVKLSEERREDEDYTYYEFLRKLVNRSLEVLEKSFFIESELQNEIDRIKTELYQTQNPTKPLFEMEATVETVATIRPEYIKYIQLYGLPEGGVFDTEKLADIITIMEAENNPQ